MTAILKKKTLILSVFAFLSSSWALTELIAGPLGGERDAGVEAVSELIRDGNPDDAFNGIHPEEFENFYRDWHLVTARYRIDRDQQRVTFANDLAWKALAAGSKAFPTGSMFVKAGFQSATDPLFPSSKKPGSQLHLLVMKRDFEKYPETDGWGYALLIRFGSRLSAGENKVNVKKYNSIRDFETACHACHKVAAAQDFVFSRPMFDAALSYKNHQFVTDSFEQKFLAVSGAKQLEIVDAVLNDKRQTASVSREKFFVFEMPLFEGSLPELKAPLTNLANRKNSPHLVFDHQSKLFAMSWPLEATKDCTRREAYFTGCLDKTIPWPNLNEVTVMAVLCDGITVDELRL